MRNVCILLNYASTGTMQQMNTSFDNRARKQKQMMSRNTTKVRKYAYLLQCSKEAFRWKLLGRNIIILLVDQMCISIIHSIFLCAIFP